tara:strand:- start:36264 stop:36551 length:288 start_codon:yes stop_codon:yes gene_type:complete
MFTKLIVWSHSVFAETVTAMCINTVALIGTLAVWADLEMIVKVTIGLVDAVIAVTSLFWLRSKTKRNYIETERAGLELEREKFEFEQLKANANRE